jgi:hypothetical protein
MPTENRYYKEYPDGKVIEVTETGVVLDPQPLAAEWRVSLALLKESAPNENWVSRGQAGTGRRHRRSRSRRRMSRASRHRKQKKM